MNHQTEPPTPFGAGQPSISRIFISTKCTKINQYAPDVAALPNGGRVITWTDNLAVRGNIYNSDGTLENSDFQIRPATKLPYLESSITVFADGSFNVALEYPPTNVAVGNVTVSATGTVVALGNIHSNGIFDQASIQTTPLTNGNTAAVFEQENGIKNSAI